MQIEQQLDKKKVQQFYKFCLGFLGLGLIGLMNEFYYFTLIPYAIVVFYMAMFALDKLVLLAVFVTPLAVNLPDTGFGLGISMPSEPLIILATGVFLLKILVEGGLDKKLLQHRVSWAILIYLLWITITTASSSMPMVSVKFLVSKIWYIVTFYLLGVMMFRKLSNVRLFIWLYTISLSIVILYTIYNHYGYRFASDPAHWVMSPFYNDHTAYGAALAFYMPILLCFFSSTTYNSSIKSAALIFFLLFSLAMLLSYSRASWLSLAIALAVWVVMKLRIRFTHLLLIVAVLGSLFALYQTQIVMKLEKNRQDTSDDLVKHVESITNISTDASNLERLNRWNSAFRMFQERPVLGWGPGTYSFQYAPFQLSNEMTIISTNAGNRGNAHSEYIGPLAEQGVFGLLSFLALAIVAIYTGVDICSRRERFSAEHRRIAMGILLGLIAYLVHGILNNFLDTDKASVSFWGFIAVLVAIDIYYRKEEKPSSNLQPRHQ